jgi:hypothetical protein
VFSLTGQFLSGGGLHAQAARGVFGDGVVNLTHQATHIDGAGLALELAG